MNRLAGTTSPYLLQHKDNPVAWWPWGPEALAAAKAQDKPILLSSGYSACHWCHVMAHESFENPEIAALMNENFINIKLDREERPDLDMIYQQALAAFGESGGWPLTLFMTPEGVPFWGGTYFPPEERYGRPGFPQVLTALAGAWANERPKLIETAATMLGNLQRLSASKAGPAPDLYHADKLAEHLATIVDQTHGGIGEAPKFPQVAILELLWRAVGRRANADWQHLVELTLAKMAMGGIYDHLGGGFARYSTDAKWLVPHFEKMLYDNALLIGLMTEAWRATGTELYGQRIEETIDWLVREMRQPGGGFAAALDADSEGVEGRFYVWTKDEIEAVLGAEDAAAFVRFYDVTEAGNWEGHTILNRSNVSPEISEASEQRLAAMRAKLLAVRDQRVRPGLDVKVLADWNGLAIAAIADAAMTFAVPEWLDVARAAFAFIAEEMQVDGVLRHAWAGGWADHPATLEDYAAMANAALVLYQATGDAAYLTQALAWLGVVERDFADAAGGYFLTATGIDDVLVRVKSGFDSATPSGAGMLAFVLAKLFLLTGVEDYRSRAQGLFIAYAADMRRAPLACATLYNAMDLLERGVQVVLVGTPGDPALRELVLAAWQAPQPNRVVTLIAEGTSLPADHPAAAKLTGTGAGGPALPARAYVCKEFTCLPPQSDPQAVLTAIAA